MSQSRRPVIGGEPVEPASAPEAKAAWDGYLKTGQSGALEVKAGLSGGATSGGYVVPYERGDPDMAVEPVEAWIAPYRVVRL